MRSLRVDDATFDIGRYQFGFADRVTINNGVATGYSVAELGPLGTYRILVSADVAWGLLAAVIVGSIVIFILLARRRERM